MTKLYSVHLCGGDEKECEDVEVVADSIESAEQWALNMFPQFKGVRVQSEMNEETWDWIDYL